eukprot:2663146-Pleurochrysis_carterae.AAC.1
MALSAAPLSPVSAPLAGVHLTPTVRPFREPALAAGVLASVCVRCLVHRVCYRAGTSSTRAYARARAETRARSRHVRAGPAQPSPVALRATVALACAVPSALCALLV